ncbi:MAG: N-glycosylase/DNA lyase [Candidatus Gracilibacteria bacterium]|nr:N-glycosylase/DNA lyase [Candidatus Gracilibacteria bacterium]
MQKLLTKLQKYTLNDAIKLEETDRQFIALKKLIENNKSKEETLALVIANSIICYQLSGTGENYWEEFSSYFLDKEITFDNIIGELSDFMIQSKNNKRFIDTKINRLKKLEFFLRDFSGKGEYFYSHMLELRDILANIMNQKKDAKTIVFAVKMFGYIARNIYVFIPYPKEIFIPIDSRLTNLFEKYKEDYTDINKFYLDLSIVLDIALLHLDAIVWINYEELMSENE